MMDCILWLSCGDENTKFFQAFAKGRKMANIVWSLRDRAGEEVSSFPVFPFSKELVEKSAWILISKKNYGPK